MIQRVGHHSESITPPTPADLFASNFYLCMTRILLNSYIFQYLSRVELRLISYDRKQKEGTVWEGRWAYRRSGVASPQGVQSCVF